MTYYILLGTVSFPLRVLYTLKQKLKLNEMKIKFIPIKMTLLPSLATNYNCHRLIHVTEYTNIDKYMVINTATGDVRTQGVVARLPTCAANLCTYKRTTNNYNHHHHHHRQYYTSIYFFPLFQPSTISRMNPVEPYTECIIMSCLVRATAHFMGLGYMSMQ